MQQLHAACICTHVVSYQPGAVEVQTVLLLLLYGLKSSRSCSLPWQQCGSRDSVTETPTHFNPYRFRQTLFLTMATVRSSQAAQIVFLTMATVRFSQAAKCCTNSNALLFVRTACCSFCCARAAYALILKSSDYVSYSSRFIFKTQKNAASFLLVPHVQQ